MNYGFYIPALTDVIGCGHKVLGGKTKWRSQLKFNPCLALDKSIERDALSS